MTQPLLIEIGVEELPAIPLLKIVKQIERSWADILKNRRLESEFEFLYTPRRLVLLHSAIADKQPDSIIEMMGPPIQAAFKDGEPTQAALGFAKKCGVSVEELGRADKGGREVLYHKQELEGAMTASLLPDMIRDWVSSMSFGKMMRWGSRGDEFIRPIRWFQVRLGDDVVPAEHFGVDSSNITYAHRMVNEEPIEVSNIDKYEEILLGGGVMLRPTQREALILSEFDKLESEYGVVIDRDAGLLAEVVAITENPKALLGTFDESFLELPPEVIITSMKEHQRYFPVFSGGKIANKFVVVSNAYTDDYSKVIAGNERVLRPRLSDALFFYRNDLERGLSTDGLEKVQFIDGLGTLADKIEREKKIAFYILDKNIAAVQGETGKNPVELHELMGQAVTLAKADLMSEMVYEFTELQGLMGYYYAKALGEDLLVYNAIKEQYMPTGEGADLPSSRFSAIVAMSNKLDTLIGLFSVGKIPTGSKDPFALRRAASGIIRILSEYNFIFLLSDDLFTLSNKPDYNYYDPEDSLEDFIKERLYKIIDANPSVISAVLATGRSDIVEIEKIVTALNDIVSTDGFREDFATFKRVANISKDIEIDDYTLDKNLFEKPEEEALYMQALDAIDCYDCSDYKEKLEKLFGLKPALEAYFDNVMVNVEDEAVRNNRLKTIGIIYDAFKNIADIKEITV
jgi:glycyl-tRNA synthetase beta chain